MSSHKNEQTDSVIITAEKTRFMNKIQKNLIAAQELGDEKLQIVNQLQELIDHKTRQLDHDFKNLDYGKDEPMAIIAEVISKEVRAPSPVILPSVPTNNSATVQPVLATATSSVVSSAIAAVIAPVVLPSSAVISNSSTTASNNTSSNSNNNERSSKRVRRTRTETGTGSEVSTPEIPSVAVIVEPPPIIKPVVTQSTANVIQKKGGAGSGKKKKRKTRGTQGNGGNNQSNTREDTPPVEPIDPDEPTYCLCDQVFFFFTFNF